MRRRTLGSFRVWRILTLTLKLFQGGFPSDALLAYHGTRIHPTSSSLYDTSSTRINHGTWNEDQAEDTRKLIEAQQRQIEQLAELVSKKFASIDNSERREAPSTSNLSPLKVMLFIDGTWLYYSLHTRDNARDPIQLEFGPGWQSKYNVDWVNLPRVIGYALQQQDIKAGWMPISASGESQVRPVEVVRVSVYTSFRRDTPKTSLRYQMFQDMVEAKYDVLMLETIGVNEKCIDIQLAVDMLHYATVPDAYDVALLLTGDKDFIPAMVRSRQKGRRVGLVSMRAHSSKSFFETPNIKDYEIIWLDDHLSSIIKPRNTAAYLQGNRPRPLLSEYTLLTVIGDFVKCSELPSISSRDIGRYMKPFVIGGRSMLDEVKEIYGGLYQFLVLARIFAIDKNPLAKEYWVGLKKDSFEEELAEAYNKSQLSQDELEFLNTYSPSRLQKQRSKFYSQTLATLEKKDRKASVAAPERPADYSTKTVTELRELCRGKGLKVSGKKSELVERLEGASEDDSSEDDSSFRYLEDLILEYLHASGGKSSSRGVGRYFTANKPSPHCTKDNPSIKTALHELKQQYGSLRQFVGLSEKVEEEEGSDYEFFIHAPSRPAR